MKLRYHIRNAEHLVEFNFNKDGLQEAKKFRSNHPEFKRRKIREVLQALPSQITPGVVYKSGRQLLTASHRAGNTRSTRRVKMFRNINELADEITNIRYSDEIGKIAFDVGGQMYLIKETEVVLVGAGRPAQLWIATHYGYLIG